MINFKVGDWVRTPKGIFQIEDIDDHDFIEQVTEDIQLYFTDKTERWEWRNNCTLWQPKDGEWCWFKVQKHNYPSSFVWGFGKYVKSEICEIMGYETRFVDCAPISELPSF